MLQSVPRNARRRGRLLRLARAKEEGKSVSSLASQARMVPPSLTNNNPRSATPVNRIISTKTIMRVRDCQLAALKVLITLAALNGASLCGLARAEEIETVAQVARRIDARLRQMESIAVNDTATTLAQSFLSDLGLLKRQSVMVFGEREKRLQEESDNLRR